MLWQAELATLDRAIASIKDRAAANPSQWILEAELAGRYGQRARLTGSYDDHAEADAALERAFAVSPDGSGPWLARAAHNFSLHRLDVVEPDLQRAEAFPLLTDDARSAIGVLRSRLQAERGDYATARATLETAAAVVDSPAAHAARAHLATQLGDIATAEAELDRVEALTHSAAQEPHAWIHLQRGLLDMERGHLDDALAHYADADAELPGYWLIEEHIAEVEALDGRPARALELYLPVAERSPELMSATAEALQALGRHDEAATWVARADAGFDALLERFPEAAYGHALDHVLTFGTGERAVDLAEANVALRANGLALDQLAQAYTKAGRPDDAAEAAARARATGWVPLRELRAGDGSGQ